jgi:hypothetical protein
MRLPPPQVRQSSCLEPALLAPRRLDLACAPRDCQRPRRSLLPRASRGCALTLLRRPSARVRSATHVSKMLAPKHWDEACHINDLSSGRGPIGISSLPSPCTCILPCDAWRVSNTSPTISLRPDTACNRATFATSSSKSPLSATVASRRRATVTPATNFEHSAAAGVCAGRQLASSRVPSAHSVTDSRDSCAARSCFPL